MSVFSEAASTYSELEGIESSGFELVLPGLLVHVLLIPDTMAENADQRLPHVAVQRVADEYDPLAPQPLQEISHVHPGRRKQERITQVSITECAIMKLVGTIDMIRI